VRMMFKCKKCGTVYTPGKFVADCPECGSTDVEVIYDQAYTQPEIAPQPD